MQVMRCLNGIELRGIILTRKLYQQTEIEMTHSWLYREANEKDRFYNQSSFVVSGMVENKITSKRYCRKCLLRHCVPLPVMAIVEALSVFSGNDVSNNVAVN
ncbi:hypothetical protein BaRGS_00019028 [Batillaria attramentaria]|uniref:Uncharacterized protein n=1 Tax=Batillaria attramentaria TaxID=370345 RepID=A0ABD0KS08_9CAEN